QVCHSDLSDGKPKKLQCSFKNAFSVSCDPNLLGLLRPPRKMESCQHCGLFGALRCSQCVQAYYCSADCQKKDWPRHRVVCRPVNQRAFRLPQMQMNKSCLNIPSLKQVQANSTSVDSLKTKEHNKKIMLSDLQTLGIKKAMEVQGTVTEFKSPGEFYIQMRSPQVLDQMSKLSLKLQKCNTTTVIQEQYIAVKGEVCIAKCSLDQTWNRVLIKDMDILEKKAQVFYIDYGNEENIPLSCIRALHKDTELLFPPCAIKCSFANYDPKGKGWNEDIASFSSQLVGRHCSVTVVDVLQEEMMLSFAVDVVLAHSEVRSHVIPGYVAKGGDSPRVSENHSKQSGRIIPEDEDSLYYTNLFTKFVSLSIGDEFSGVVCHVENPGTFFCQQMCSARQLSELEVSLNKYCDKFPSSPLFRPAAGSVCCAQFTEDNLWYRAAVTAYASEDTVLVDYTDYGNSDSVPLTRLRPLIPGFMELPAQAIRCTLAGVKPLLGTWTSVAISFMKQWVKDKVFTVKVVDKESSASVVELVDASVTPVINISSLLIEKGCAAESRIASPATGMSDAVQANEDTTREKMCKWIKLTPKQTVNVIVSAVYTPGEFYCQISDTQELLALTSLNKSLSEYCQKTPPDVFEPANGEPCCAFFSGDGTWYRAVVRSVTTNGTVQVSFVDYGNVEEVPLDKMRQISSSFLKLPFQAIKCWLSGIKPDKHEWTPEDTKRFHRYTSGLGLQARVISLSKDGAGVVLIDNSTGYPKVINELLTSENLAVKEVLQDNHPNKPVDQKVVTLHFLQFLLETSFGHWKSIELAVDETISVRVTEVVSPDLFYAVPVKTEDQEKLRRQLVKLESYCKSCHKQPFQPKVGEACCAQFSGNGSWCRAVVLEASQSAVKVLYADYGNTETLPLSRVLPITDADLELPFQTITCSLAGVEKAEWSPLALGKLTEILLNEHFIITVKGINGNVNLVILEKHCENGVLNVADQLLKEGLVKPCSDENLQSEHQGSRGEGKCCCTELKVQLKKHEQILRFLLNQYGNPDGFTEMNNLL
ncbi:Tudor domain-containing protein 1, partial [Acanthisitta chloris]